MDILGKRILVVTAHPDDESFAAAGTLWKNSAAGGEVKLICATHGEKGRAHLDVECTEEELKERRTHELAAALKVIGVAGCDLLSYPDGGLKDYEADFAKDISAAIADFKPDVVMGFGPDGLTNHTDHRAAHRSAVAASREASVPYVAFALPPEPVGDRLYSFLTHKRYCDSYEDCSMPPSPDVHMQIDQELKLKALRCHESQFKGLDPHRIFPPDVAEHFLANEYFVNM